MINTRHNPKLNQLIVKDHLLKSHTLFNLKVIKENVKNKEHDF